MEHWSPSVCQSICLSECTFAMSISDLVNSLCLRFGFKSFNKMLTMLSDTLCKSLKWSRRFTGWDGITLPHILTNCILITLDFSFLMESVASRVWEKKPVQHFLPSARQRSWLVPFVYVFGTTCLVIKPKTSSTPAKWVCWYHLYMSLVWHIRGFEPQTSSTCAGCSAIGLSSWCLPFNWY